MNKSLVIIPTFNEAESVPVILKALLDLPDRLDILVVDDGSPDGTADICRAFDGGRGRIHVENRGRKMGLGSAYRHGFAWGLSRGYQSMIEIDADGSHRPEDLVSLIRAFDSDSRIDLVIGSRWIAGGAVKNWARKRELLSRAANKYTKFALGIPVADITAGFRIYRSTILEKIDFSTVTSEGYCFQIEMTRKVVALNGVIKEVPITFVEREFGVSKMSMGIVIEAMKRVTLWGLQRFFHIY